jgi:hypothetical protein
MLGGDKVKGRKRKMIYLLRTTGVFKGTQLVALLMAIMLKENVTRKFWLQDVGSGIRHIKGKK